MGGRYRCHRAGAPRALFHRDSPNPTLVSMRGLPWTSAPDSTRPDVAMFLLWFAYVLHRRHNANAAAG
jgi:hypothetical protein